MCLSQRFLLLAPYMGLGLKAHRALRAKNIEVFNCVRCKWVKKCVKSEYVWSNLKNIIKHTIIIQNSLTYQFKKNLWQSNWVSSLGQFSNFHSVQQTASHRCHKSWKLKGLSRSFFQSLQHQWLAHLLDKMEVEKEITWHESSDVLSCGNRRFIIKSILLSFEGGFRIIHPTWAFLYILDYIYEQLC